MKHKGKKKKIGIQRKLLVPIMLINALSFLAIGMVTYRSLRSQMIDSEKKAALSIAHLTAKHIPTETLQSVSQNLKRDENYWSIYDILSQTETDSTIAYAYLVGQYDDGYRYLISTTDTDETAFSDVSPEYLEETKKAFATDGYCTSEVEHSEYGTLLTTTTHILSDDGSILGILQVDFDISETLESVNLIAFIITMSGLFLCFLTCILIYFIIKRILGGVKQINQKLSELTSNHGDLTQRIDIHSSDEIGFIGTQLNNVLEYIQHIIQNVYDMSQQISTSMQNINDSTKKSTEDTDNVSSVMQEMSAMMEQTNASLEQITATVSKMKRNAEEIFHKVEQGQELSKDIQNQAKQILHNAESETTSVEKGTAELTESVHEKIEQSKNSFKIEELSGRILEITDEISLLALNASIEAARAGESGRGFTVVAEQITQLSNYSAETAKEIQDISKIVIQSIKELSAESDAMIQFVSEKTLLGFNQLVQVGKQYQTNANYIQDMYVELESQMLQLETGMRGISEATSEVNEAVGDNTQGISQVAEAAAQLNETIRENNTITEEGLLLTQSLKDELNKFVI